MKKYWHIKNPDHSFLLLIFSCFISKLWSCSFSSHIKTESNFCFHFHFIQDNRKINHVCCHTLLSFWFFHLFCFTTPEKFACNWYIATAVRTNSTKSDLLFNLYQIRYGIKILQTPCRIYFSSNTYCSITSDPNNIFVIK